MFVFIIIITVVCLENRLKQWMEERLGDGSLEPFGKGHGSRVYFRKFHNTGAAFNFLNHFPKQMKIFHALTLLYVSVRLLGESRPVSKSGLALLVGGGLSNFLDRLRLGYVRDYVSFRVGPGWFRKLVFNLSDFSIFAGLLLVLFDSGRRG